MDNLYSIGYGSRSIEEVLELLKRYRIHTVVDVRSSPYSSFKPEFSRENLLAALQDHGISYSFLGDQLGGRPDDADCYTDESSDKSTVDYVKVRESSAFKSGILRLLSIGNSEAPACVLCSEEKPEQCHRSTMIGMDLESRGISILHIDELGDLQSQRKVIQRRTGGQERLFDEPLFKSKRKYQVKK